LTSLAKNLDRSRFEVLVSAKSGGPLEDGARSAGLSFFPVSLSKKIFRGITKEIASILRGNEIDILHTHGGVAGLFGRWAAKGAGTPVMVHTIHGIHYLHYRNPFMKYSYIVQERYLSRRTDAVIFVSKADYEQGRRLRLAPASRMRLIQNGVDTRNLLEKLGRTPEQENLRAALNLSPPVVGTVARLHRQKGVRYLLRAAGDIRLRFPEAKVVIVGGGPLEKSLRREVSRMKAEQFIRIPGERPDALEILSLFDIFVLPSLWEGLPLVLIEAAALGKPIIASDIDGVREVIRDGENGVLVPLRNPVKLAEAVVRLLEDRTLALKLGESAKTGIPPLFTHSRMIEAIEGLYLELYEKKKTFL
jgi:glycosyltransferase involved in cell wall biosynthesis